MSGVRILHQSNKRLYPKRSFNRKVSATISENNYEILLQLTAQTKKCPVESLCPDDVELYFNIQIAEMLIFKAKQKLGCEYNRRTKQFYHKEDLCETSKDSTAEQNPESQFSEPAEDKSAYSNCLWSVE